LILSSLRTNSAVFLRPATKSEGISLYPHPAQQQETRADPVVVASVAHHVRRHRAAGLSRVAAAPPPPLLLPPRGSGHHGSAPAADGSSGRRPRSGDAGRGLRRGVGFRSLKLVSVAMNEPLPTDPVGAAYGRLANGLTYYVRSNPKPRMRAALSLAVKIGSLLTIPCLLSYLPASRVFR
jgi:hypothetical protein